MPSLRVHLSDGRSLIKAKSRLLRNHDFPQCVTRIMCLCDFLYQSRHVVSQSSSASLTNDCPVETTPEHCEGLPTQPHSHTDNTYHRTTSHLTQTKPLALALAPKQPSLPIPTLISPLRARCTQPYAQVVSGDLSRRPLPDRQLPGRRLASNKCHFFDPRWARWRTGVRRERTLTMIVIGVITCIAH